MPTFGENLKRIRKERRMTQEEMAEKLHTSKQVISRYENGQRIPRADVAARYAETLNVPLSSLISERTVIPAEILEALGNMTLNELVDLFNSIRRRR